MNDWCMVSTVELAAESPVQFHTLTPISDERLVWHTMFDNAKAVLFQNICSIIQRQMCSCSHRFDFTQLEMKARPPLIKCTSKLNMLWVRYFAHGRRDSFQIVIKDCPKTTHAFSAILGSWHVSIFAQFFIPTDRLMESVTLLHFSSLYASKNVVFMSSCGCWFGNWRLKLRLF